MDSQDKKFDPHALLPKDHPLHPENASREAQKPVEKEVSSPQPPSKPPVVLEVKKTEHIEKPKPTFTTQKKRSPVGLIIGILLLFGIIGGGVYVVYSQGYLANIIYPMAPLSPIEMQKTAKVNVGSMAAWKTYTSSDSGFTLRHPASVNATVLREGSQVVTVFTLVGPTQKKDTEFYDGISLQFLSGELEGETLEALVQKDSEELAQHAKITKEVTPVTVSGINGFTYSASGVGDVAFIYLPDGGGYLKVANLTKDPTNQGYKKIVEDMLSTFRFTAEGDGS